MHTAWAARPGLKDVAVSRILADEFAFARTVVKVEAVMRSTGYGARRIPVTLSSDGRALRRKWVDLGSGEQEVRVEFEFTPAKVGKYVYEIATPVAEDEAVAENNTRSFVLRVIRDKIRVLQVVGQPSWDVRALRGMLKQNPNVDLISFFILRTQDDILQANNDELALIPFPTQELFEEQLPSFDLIVLQNFDYLPYGIAPYLENIKSYVMGGGGLVMLGGALSFGSGGYAGTPVADVLPVELPPGHPPPDRLIDQSAFSPQLTEQGRVHPITALRFQPSDNAGGLARAAAAARHQPGRGTAQGRAGAGRAPDPAHPGRRSRCRSSRRGRSARAARWPSPPTRCGAGASSPPPRPATTAAPTSSCGRTRSAGSMDDPDLRYLRVESDRIEYAPGAPVRLGVRLLDRDYKPRAAGQVSVEVARGSDPARTEKVARVDLSTGESGEASHELSRLDAGVYRVTARSQVGERAVEASDIFLVRQASEELSRPAPTQELLQVIADSTGGLQLGPIEELPADLPMAEPRVVRVDRRSDVELWSRPWLLVAALLLLGLEWGLRGRIGYL